MLLAVNYLDVAKDFLTRDYYTSSAYVCLAFLVLVFLVIGRQDILMLVRRPGRLGMGLSRIWAVARVCVAEARAARVWVIPLLWFAACMIINLLLKPYDVTERISLYIRVLLMGQEFVVMIAMVLLAVYSIPHEREKRTIVTTGSKPLSRLEFLLGKVVGFGAVAALMLAAMALLSLGFLHFADLQIRRQARAEYAEQELHFEQNVTDATGKKAQPPERAKMLLAEQGSLFAYNYIMAPRGVSVAGKINYNTDPPTRLLKGGSQQTAYFHLPELPAGASNRPYFTFAFGVQLAPGLQKLPDPVEMNVTFTLKRDSRQSFEKTLKMNLAPGDQALAELFPEEKDAHAGGYQGVAYVNMTPPDDAMFFNYGTDPGSVGPVIVKVQFPTPGIYFGLIDDITPRKSNLFVNDLDPVRMPPGMTSAVPNYPPMVTGFEKRDYQQISGPEEDNMEPEVGSFQFKHVSLDDVPLNKDGTFNVSLNFEVDAGKAAGVPTRARISVYQPFSKTPLPPQEIVVDEKRDMVLSFPSAGILTGAPTDLLVDVRCLTKDHWIGLKPNSVRLDQHPSSFSLNFLKSESVIFCEALLVIVIGVAASVRLGWPTAILLTGTVVSLGYVFDFVQTLASTGTDSLLNAATRRELQGSVIYATGSALNSGASKMLYFLVNLVPDFSRYDHTSYIVESRNMPMVVLVGHIAITLLYVVPFIALGFLLIRKQELA